MNSCALIVRTCRHILPDGLRCQQPAVRGRSCCRHHLDAQTRLHNMARARRRSLIPRLRVPETLRDLDWNQFEVNRLLATERLDPDVALLILRGMDLCATALRAELTPRSRPSPTRMPNPNGIYDVPLNALFPQSLSEMLSQVLENTGREEEGLHQSCDLAHANWYPPPRDLNQTQRSSTHEERRAKGEEQKRAASSE